MVRLPEEFIATKFPGYFFNTANKTLYSLKVSGELRALPLHKPSHWNRLKTPAYRVSVKGNRRVYLQVELERLAAKPRQDEIIPVAGQGK